MKLKKVVEGSHEEGGMARGQLERALVQSTEDKRGRTVVLAFCSALW